MSWLLDNKQPTFSVTYLPKANNLDPIFNFTSYLCSTDGCKLILWQRAATVPIRGSILSESADWHQEQLQGGRGKVTTEMRLNVQKQESSQPWCLKGETDTQISTEEK